MTYCVIHKCKNSKKSTFKKGTKVCVFPLRDVNRCKVWISYVKKEMGLSNWIPNKHSVLCEEHFVSTVWEPRQDLKRLKQNAVPGFNVEEIIEIPEPSHNQGVFLESNETFHCSEGNLVIEEQMPDSDDGSSPIFKELNFNEIKDCNAERLEKIMKLYEKSERLRLRTKQKLKKCKKENKALKEKLKNIKQFPQYINKLLNEDQIKLLSGEYKKIPSWSNNSLQKAFALKFSCGTVGYKELIKQNFPLPTIKTLRNKLQVLNFKPGILEDVFEFLKIKVNHFSSLLDKHCHLFIDEMAITPSQVYDQSSKQFFGKANILTTTGEEKLATHALVFMVGGLASRWKQVVGYDLTTDSVDGYKLKPKIIEYITKLENIGLFVHGVTSDMGSSNKAVWKAFNITAGRNAKTINSCEHPVNSQRQLYFFHDVPHAFKNFKEGLLNNKVVTISDVFVLKNNLPTNQVKASHLSDMCEVNKQLDYSLSLTPKLKSKMIERNSHFNKMKVGNTTGVISHEVGSAMNYYSLVSGQSEFITTAWFISSMAKWFKLLSNRILKLALSKHNEEIFKETIDYLKEIMELVQSLKVGEKNMWKPWQTGILITTKSAIELSLYLLECHNFKFILTSRYAQDCLENLFSVLRAKHVIPTALDVLNDLKLICISQYMKDLKSSSYEEDDRDYLSEFVDYLIDKSKSKKKINSKQTQSIYEDLYNKCANNILNIAFNILELNCLYYMGGYIIQSIVKKQNICDSCIKETGSLKDTNSIYASLTRCKCFANDGLFFINERTFQFVVLMESIFRAYYDSCHQLPIDLSQFYLLQMHKTNFSLPDCHNLQEKIMKKFISMRLKNMSEFKCNKDINQEYLHASKSMAMHLTIK